MAYLECLIKSQFLPCNIGKTANTNIEKYIFLKLRNKVLLACLKIYRVFYFFKYMLYVKIGHFPFIF